MGETLLFTHGFKNLRLAMPTYEYKCEKCGDFETWQSIKDNAMTACPTCGSKVERQISANVGFVFKGSGFYQNEYKTQPKAPASPKVSDEAKASDSAKAAPDKATDKIPEVKSSTGSSEVKTAGAESKTSVPAASGSPDSGTKNS